MVRAQGTWWHRRSEKADGPVRARRIYCDARCSRERACRPDDAVQRIPTVEASHLQRRRTYRSSTVEGVRRRFSPVAISLAAVEDHLEKAAGERLQGSAQHDIREASLRPAARPAHHDPLWPPSLYR